MNSSPFRLTTLRQAALFVVLAGCASAASLGGALAAIVS